MKKGKPSRKERKQRSRRPGDKRRRNPLQFSKLGLDKMLSETAGNLLLNEAARGLTFEQKMIVAAMIESFKPILLRGGSLSTVRPDDPNLSVPAPALESPRADTPVQRKTESVPLQATKDSIEERLTNKDEIGP
jgi:hypothetical protein